MITATRGLLAGAVVAALLTGCAAPNPYANQQQNGGYNNTEKGAGFGALAGRCSAPLYPAIMTAVAAR